MRKLKSEKVFARMVEIRRTLHRWPELAFHEVKTAQTIITELERLGIPYSYGGEGEAVIGRLRGTGPGTRIALRADMDGLPGTENTGLPFASENPGCMHACGHDGHMAMLLGAAALLKEEPPPGEVVFVFQPAEERGGGARVVLASGALDGVAAIFGGHVTRHYQVGEIMVAAGVITAQSDRLSIHIRGKGGHGARPHEAVDAVVVAGLMITAIQTLVSREINPAHPSVITIGKVEAGSAANVIAEEARLEGSIRTTLPEVREHIHRGIERMAMAVGAMHNARVEVAIEAGYPPVVNSSREAEIARAVARAVLGDQGVVDMDHPSMGSEDFSYYLEAMPGCYVRFGACEAGCENIPLHSPSFDFDEEALKVGAAYFDAVARAAISANAG